MTTEKYATLCILLMIIPALTYLSITILPERTQRYIESHKSIPIYVVMSLIVIACFWCLSV